VSDEGPIVRLQGFARSFGDVEAVRGIDLAIARGEMFGLIGPDGAGKSTTLKAMVGLLSPTSGTIATCGLDPVRGRKALSRRVGYLAQRFSLYGDLTVDENLAFFAELHGVDDVAARRDAMLELVRLAPFRRRLADKLSGGMKQKLALACTLVHTPELILLDEPTTGVDPVSRRDFWRLLAEVRRAGTTIVVSTPYLDEAERCTRIALFAHGRTLAVDTPDALRDGAGPGWHELLAADRRAAERVLAGLPGVLDLEAFGERLHFRLDPAGGGATPDRVRTALDGAGIAIVDLSPIRPSLEDVFLLMIRAAEPAVVV
jgi:ABC-2 type transport system ATP-binding protein